MIKTELFYKIKKGKTRIRFSILIIGPYLSFIDNLVLNNGILGVEYYLQQSQQKTKKKTCKI
jgi:hypothetical protein